MDLSNLERSCVLALAVLAIGGCTQSTESTGKPAAAGAPGTGLREVDFGFVELNPGLPAAITSYKYGKAMLLYAGESFEYEVHSEGPLPPLELRLGDQVLALPGAAGKVTVDGPAGAPLPAMMLARGERASLPGGAPPRIAVKVQVHGEARSR